jgi:hypothetical protein
VPRTGTVVTHSGPVVCRCALVGLRTGDPRSSAPRLVSYPSRSVAPCGDAPSAVGTSFRRVGINAVRRAARGLFAPVGDRCRPSPHGVPNVEPKRTRRTETGKGVGRAIAATSWCEHLITLEPGSPDTSSSTSSLLRRCLVVTCTPVSRSITATAYATTTALRISSSGRGPSRRESASVTQWRGRERFSAVMTTKGLAHLQQRSPIREHSWRCRESNPGLSRCWRGFSERSQWEDLGSPPSTGT